MKFSKNKYFKLFFIFALLIITILFVIIFLNKSEKNAIKAKEPIIINLLTSVHPSLPWNFKAINQKVIIKPGEVRTIEYIVENLKDKKSTGIATFAYFPNKFGSYIRKLNCFCYDAKTLKAKQKDRYSVVILIDPEVTKDSKTKNVKEVTMLFTFFDFKEYKESKT